MKKLLAKVGLVAKSLTAAFNGLDPRDRCILLGLLICGGSIGTVSATAAALFIGAAVLYIGLRA